MSNKNRHTISVLVAFSLIMVAIYSFIVIKFFTDDKLWKDTLGDVPFFETIESNCSEVAEQEKTENSVPQEQTENTESTSQNPNEGTSENTNEVQSNEAPIVNSTKIAATNTKETSKEQAATSSRAATERTSTQEQTQQQQQQQPVQQVQTPQVTTRPDAIGTIEIPKTGVNLPILQKVSSSGMEVATCLMYSTGALNISGTSVIVGHNYNNGKLFSNNPNLQIGDVIYVTTSNGNRIQYTIYDKFVTTEEDIDYVFRNTTGQPQIALSTCYNNDLNRLVILAK